MNLAVPDRRATDKGLGGKVLSMEERLAKGDERMSRIEKTLGENTADTKEVLEIIKMGKSFFRVMGYFGSMVKWALGIATAFGAVYAAWTHK